MCFLPALSLFMFQTPYPGTPLGQPGHLLSAVVSASFLVQARVTFCMNYTSLWMWLCSSNLFPPIQSWAGISGPGLGGSTVLFSPQLWAQWHSLPSAVGNRPWREYLHHGNWQTLQSRLSVFRQGVVQHGPAYQLLNSILSREYFIENKNLVMSHSCLKHSLALDFP